MDEEKIDEYFINFLRLNLSLAEWVFNDTEENEIVPKELTHDYLLNNFNIDESIYEYYHLPMSNFLSDTEFQKMKSSGFLGKKQTALTPYSNIIYSAYYSRSDLYTKLAGVVYDRNSFLIEGKKIIYLTDLIPYFKEYSKGFKNGFNEFDNTQIKPFLTMLVNEQDYVNKVFEFVTKKIFFSHCWASLQSGFARNLKNDIIKAFENGQKQGYFYKAWSVIFSNNNLFASLFQEHFKNIQSQSIVKQKPEQNRKLITFKNSETIEKIHSELKGYFPNKEAELLKTLQGEQLSEILLFPHNQNKFVEVFRRLKYNGFLLNTDTETRNWICTTFQFVKKGFLEPQPFNDNTVWNNLNKGKGEPTKKERICITDWLPYISPKNLAEAAQKEKI